MYYFALAGLFLYSYALMDPNITFFNHPLWTAFRNVMVGFGYHQRDLSTFVFIVLMSLLTYSHYQFVKRGLRNPIRVAIYTVVIVIFAYPFLSRDLFNYMFDARIITFHHGNPYIQVALEFPHDQWLRFMHWTHRTYPYGPTFLPLTLFPSFLSLGKFILNFVLFKLLWGMTYLWTVYMLSKIKKSYAIFFATHPIIIVEGLVNSHNDFIAVAFAIMGVYYTSSKLLSAVGFSISAGIKYITAPLLLLVAYHKSTNARIATFLLMTGIICYVSFNGDIQQWYVLNFFAFTPYFYSMLTKFLPFFYGILLSYYPFTLYGDWDTHEKVALKQMIIIFGLVANVLWLLYKRQSPLLKK